MFRTFLIIIIIFFTASCKQDEVSFTSVDTSDRDIAPVNPPVNAGGGDEVPLVGPEINFISKPKDHKFGGQTSAVYRVQVGDYPVASLQCFLDGTPLACKVEDQIVFDKLSLGVHSFEIEVSDEKGLSDQEQVEWNIANEYVNKVEFLRIQPDERDADILFVVDNSISMDVEQREVGRKINNLIDSLRGLTWRIGIITTDPYKIDPSSQQLNPLADGMLLKFPGNRYYIDSSMPESQALNFFQRTINRPELGNGHERGIRNTYRSIERSMSGSSDPADLRLMEFFRQKAPLSVVIVSDENETTRNGIGVPFEDIALSNGDELIKIVTQKWGPQKRFQFNSIIVRDGDFSCIKENESFGRAYQQLSIATGGVVEDICSQNYNTVLKNVGDGIVNLHKVYPLECLPQDVNGNGLPDLQIISPTGSTVPGYSLDGQKVEFDRPLTTGDYQFVYSCVLPVPN